MPPIIWPKLALEASAARATGKILNMLIDMWKFLKGEVLNTICAIAAIGVIYIA
jgi:hypothetical protein